VKVLRQLLGILLALGIALGCRQAGAANNDGVPEALRDAFSRFDLIETAAGRAETQKELQQSIGDLVALRAEAEACADRESVNLSQVRASLETLGDASRIEASEVTSTRKSLGKEQAGIEKRLAGCKLLQVRADTLSRELNVRLDEVKRAYLLVRSPNLLKVVAAGLKPVDWEKLLHDFFRQDLGLSDQDPDSLLLLLVLAGGLSLLGVTLLHRLGQTLLVKHPEPADLTSSMLVAMAAHGIRLRYYFAILPAVILVTGVSGWQGGQLLPITELALLVLALLTFQYLNRVFLSPHPQAAHYLPFPEDASRRFSLALRLLAILIFIPFAWHSLPFAVTIPESQADLLRLILLGLLMLAIQLVVWRFFSLRGTKGLGFIRATATLAIVAALLALVIGFPNVARYLLTGVVLTLLVVGLTWLISNLIEDFFDGLDQGRYAWQRQLQDMLGAGDAAHLPGSFWLRLFSVLALFFIALLMLIRIWDLSPRPIEEFGRLVVEGFTIGGFTLVPGRILVAAVSLGLLLSLVSWLKTRFEENWLKRSRMEPGARNAVVTLGGYFGAGLAILITLGVAGLDLSNLAIVFGALSVGIGFGLQNIVNNFVSGIILLFERPIRKGDWIVVGNTEGYVQHISIRSTVIRTFDRADVLVPNSELISQQVTNWMLRDLKGRVRVPVSVAYGSDLELVTRILLDIAGNLSGVVLDGSVARPKVIFLRFGDSSLDLELRYFVRNVDDRLDALSATNYAIDAAFRENGIQIPFPQRDLHIRSGLAPITPGSGDAGVTRAG